jgi:hypothetical protein
VFHGPLRDRLLLTEILLSPGGERLSRECAKLCAVLLMDRDPNTDFEIERFLCNYENPRGLSKKWLEGYLSRPKPRLAIDVIRAFDGHYKQQATMRWMKLAIAGLGLLNGFLAVLTTTLALLHLLK